MNCCRRMTAARFAYPALSTKYLVLAMVLSLIGPIASIRSEDAPVATAAPAFAEVRAIFASKCMACHGNDAKEIKGGYDLRTRATAIKGGDSGEAAIVPGEPDKSPF